MISILPRRLPGTSLLILFAAAFSRAAAQQPRQLTLTEAIELAQRNSAEARSAAAQLEQRRSLSRIVGARMKPQIGLTTQLLNFDHGINQINLPDGSQQFVGQSNNLTVASLNVAQALPTTGGTISLGTQLSRADQFGNFNSRSWAATPIVLGLSQPLFQVRALDWDRRESDVALEVAERQFADSKATIAQSVANQYLALYRAEIALRNARANAIIADSVLQLNKARYRFGSVSVLEMSRSELKSLRDRMTADEAELTRDRLGAGLGLTLGLVDSTPIATAEPGLPDTTGIVSEAVIDAAARGSVAAVNFRRDSISAERQLAQARATSRASANLNGSVGFNQAGTTLPLAYDSPLGKQRATFSITLPLVQWGSGAAQVDAARYSMQSSLAIAKRNVEQVKQDIRFAARTLVVSTQQLRLATIADSIANLQFRIARLQYASGSVTYTDFLNVQQEKDLAVLGRVDAIAKLWDQYYNLKRLTVTRE